MPAIFLYLLKASVGLSIVYIFYRLLLRRLTFYSYNRWYLLGYTFLAFIIPFINIAPFFDESLSNNAVMQFIPVIEEYPAIKVAEATHNDKNLLKTWDYILLIMLTGILVLMVRLIIQYFSYLKIRRAALKLSHDEVNIYQVNENIIPFSFGNSIFINQQLHNKEEMKKIIMHEFVHVKEKHSVDIICSELLVIFNWYNPFAWLIRKAIRQNLEFIADNRVLENGFEKRNYQYLLLKVIGVSPFSIASQFNFSSLKKRIAMMNKMKSTKVHLLKFLFVLPLIAVLLAAFRSNKLLPADKKLPANENVIMQINAAAIDTLPKPNSKGYFIQIGGGKGHWVVIVKDENKKVVNKVDMSKWKANKKYYEDLYGIIPPPPVFIKPGPPPPPNSSIEMDGLIETVAIGSIPAVSGVNVTAAVSSGPAVSGIKTTTTVASTNKIAVSGVNIIVAGSPTPELSDIKAITSIAPTYKIAVSGNINTATASSITSATDATGELQSEIAEAELIIDIYKTTSRAELDKLIEEAKAKGVTLIFDHIEYNDKKRLTAISGSMKSSDSSGNFSANGFVKVRLIMYKNNGRSYFRVYISDKNEVS